MKERIHTSQAPEAIGPYSQGIVSGDLLFTAGQGPLDPATGALVEGDIAAQAEQTLKNLGAILAAAGLDYSDVLKTTCYMRDLNDFVPFNEVYARFFEEPYPARTTIEAGRLPMDIDIEIEAVARRR
jgi:2-iminobutanoate/2-iminopropanoate deaminase